MAQLARAGKVVSTRRHQPRSQGEGSSEIWEPDQSMAFLNTKREVSPITENFIKFRNVLM